MIRLFTESDITWPGDVNDSGCTLPTATGEPTYSETACDQVGHDYTDMILDVAGGCQMIMRTWKVYDLCQPGDNGCDAVPGYYCWTYVQTITVFNTTAPVITCSDPDDFCSFDPLCATGTATLSVSATDDCNELFYGYQIDEHYLLGNGFGPWTPDPGNDGTLTDNFDLGTHIIRWEGGRWLWEFHDVLRYLYN